MRWTGIAAVLALILGTGAVARGDVTVLGFYGEVLYDNDDGLLDEERVNGPSFRTFEQSVTGATQSTRLVVEGDSLLLTSTTRVDRAGDDDYGESYLRITFRLDAPATFTLSGTLQRPVGSRSGVRGVAFGVSTAVGEGSAGDEVEVARSGTLPAGDHTIDLSAQSDSQTSGSGWDVYLRVCPTGCSDGLISWKNGRGGRFSDASNWDPEIVPGFTAAQTDWAEFDLNERYTVVVGTQSTERLLVSSGVPTFVSGDYFVPGGDPRLYAIRIRGGPALTLGPGMTLRGRDAVIGMDEASDFDSQLLLDAADAELELSGTLAVGDSFGAGRLLVHAGAVTCGPLRLGARLSVPERSEILVTGKDSSLISGDVILDDSGTGHVFRVRGGATVAGGDVVVRGSDALESNPFLVVEGTATQTSTWQVGRLEVAASSLGVSDRALLRASGDASLSNGICFVAGRSATRRSELEVRGSLAVRGGFLTVSQGDLRCDGGVVVTGAGDELGFLRLDRSTATFTGTAVPAPGPIVVGSTSETGSSLDVSSASVLESTLPDRAWWIGFESGTGGKLEVGDSARGGSRLTTRGDVFVGNDDLLRGSFVEVHRGSRLAASGSVIVFRSGNVVGRREIGAPVTTVPKTGSVPRAAALAPAVIECAELVNGGTLEPGDLVIDGDYEQTAEGTLVATIGGRSPGRDADRLVVTGTARIDGRLVLAFENGYAPKAGEVFDVFVVEAGAPSGAFAAVEFTGLEPGAAFDAAFAGGRLTATSRTDTRPLAAVSVKARGKKVFEKRAQKPGLFTVSRTGATADALDVAIAVAGTARAGGDYQALPAIVTIPAGKKSVTIPVRVVDDRRREAEESIEVQIAKGPSYARGRTPRATLRIVSDD